MPTPHQLVQLAGVSSNALSQQSDIPFQDHQEVFLDVSEMQLRIIMEDNMSDFIITY